MSNPQEDRPVDHIVLAWARVARSMGEDVHVLQPGELGGVGAFRSDELMSDHEADLHWRRFYLCTGSILIVPHDPVLDGLVGRVLRIARDAEGVLQIDKANEQEVELARRERAAADVASDELALTVRAKTPPSRAHHTPTVRADSAPDDLTEIIRLDEMPTLRVDMDDHVAADSAHATSDDARTVRVDASILAELGLEEVCS